MAVHQESKDALHIWFHVQTALLGVIFIFALILNSLLIYVLHKMKSRRSNRDRASYNIERSYTYLLFHLALADMLGVVLSILFDILTNAGIQYYFTSAGCKALLPFQLASTTAQAGTYVALSYHRFRAIVHPIRAKLTVCRSLIWIAIIWIVGVALSMPYVVALYFDEKKMDCDEHWRQKHAGNIYTFAIFVVQYAAPVTLMAIFYVTIARTLHEHRIQKELVHVPTHDDVRSHRRIVKMLVTIVTVYSVCMLPHHLYWMVNGVENLQGEVSETIASVSYLFTYSNSVANPIIFFFYNKESRYHLKRFFKQLCRCCVHNMDVPFEIKKWSATWSGQSKDDSQHHEKRSSKDHLKLDQMFLAKPGDSDLGVSLPWEAQVIHSHSSEENYLYPSSSPVPDPSCPGKALGSPNDTRDAMMYYGVPNIPLKSPDENALYTAVSREESFRVDVCEEGIPRGVGKNNEESGESGDLGEKSEGSVRDLKSYKDEGGSSDSKRAVHHQTSWHDEETEVASNGSEQRATCFDDDAAYSDEDTTRVQYMIDKMLQDIKHELKQNNVVNGIKRFDDILSLSDRFSGNDWKATIDGETRDGDVRHLSEDMMGSLGEGQGIESDIRGLCERLESMPETRM